MIENNYKIQIQNNEFDVTPNQLNQLDIVKEPNGSFHCLFKNKRYVIKIVAFDHFSKTMTLKINGNPYDILIKDQYDILIDKMGLVTSASIDIKEVHAPMPGLVLDIPIKEGQEVIKGNTLLVLEAMKMENMIKSPVDGIIKSIAVESGDAVDKGQILVEFE